MARLSDLRIDRRLEDGSKRFALYLHLRTNQLESYHIVGWRSKVAWNEPLVIERYKKRGDTLADWFLRLGTGRGCGSLTMKSEQLVESIHIFFGCDLEKDDGSTLAQSTLG